MESPPYNSTALDKTDIVSFNVGGFSFQTNSSTFIKNSNGSSNYFELILNGDKIVQRDPQGYYFIDRDGDCMRVILAYLRTGRLNVPSILTKSSLIAEAQFYNIELPDIADDDRSLINVKLLRRGIYTSNWSTFFIRIVDSKYMVHGGDSSHGKEGCDKYTYEIQGQNFVVHDGPHLNASIFDNGRSLVLENYGHMALTFSPSRPLTKEISGEVPKTSYLVRASGTTVELLHNSGQVITTSTAEPDKNELLVATVVLQDGKFLVKLFGHFMQVKNCSKGKTRRYPKANIWAKKVKQDSEADSKDKQKESTAEQSKKL